MGQARHGIDVNGRKECFNPIVYATAAGPEHIQFQAIVLGWSSWWLASPGIQRIFVRRP